jgi:hypothetical protein
LIRAGSSVDPSQNDIHKLVDPVWCTLEAGAGPQLLLMIDFEDSVQCACCIAAAMRCKSSVTSGSSCKEVSRRQQWWVVPFESKKELEAAVASGDAVAVGEIEEARDSRCGC